MPSLYEGFGLPILEAFASGVPVITAKVTSIPEIAGQSAILIEPHNQENLSLSMEKICFDDDLRNDLIEKGFERAKLFSWQKTSNQTLDVYKELLN